MTGIPASAAAAMAELMPGTTSADARRAQREDFLAAAPEHEGIPALEAHHALAAPGGADHQRVDRLLAD